jgi:hypothetical protein
MSSTPTPQNEIECSCYGCTIKRQRDGLRLVDRSAEPCNPPEACATHCRCWTHSEWLDTSKCDPPNACVDRIVCGVHGKELT